MSLTNRPVVIDGFCGYGGWTNGFLAAGYRAVGIDNERSVAERYKGEFIHQDILDVDLSMFEGASAIALSPPCHQFSDMNFLRETRPPPDMTLANRSFKIKKFANRLGIPVVIENVRGARRFFPEPCVTHRGSFYLWGDVPLISDEPVPMKLGAIARARRSDGTLKPAKERQWSKGKDPRETAMIPLTLSYRIALGMLTMKPKQASP